MVDVVRADAAAKHPLQEIVLFVRAFGRLKDRKRARAVRVAQSNELLRGELHGLIPCCRAERRVPIVGRRRAIARIAEW